MDIAELRNEIDIVDRELLELFLRRMEISAEVAAWKKANGRAFHDPQREEEKLSAIAAASPETMAGYSRRLWAKLMELSRDYQRSMDGEEVN